MVSPPGRSCRRISGNKRKDGAGEGLTTRPGSRPFDRSRLAPHRFPAVVWAIHHWLQLRLVVLEELQIAVVAHDAVKDLRREMSRLLFFEATFLNESRGDPLLPDGPRQDNQRPGHKRAGGGVVHASSSSSAAAAAFGFIHAAGAASEL